MPFGAVLRCFEGLLGDTCGSQSRASYLRLCRLCDAVHRGAKIEKNPAFDPLVKGRKIGDYLDAATRMYALINQSGVMLSCIAICCTLLCFASAEQT